jgi:hypothetical protein
MTSYYEKRRLKIEERGNEVKRGEVKWSEEE